ncbi:MAG TPA: helix-turn-helix transcriptional regulator [Polyangiaceae bacterium LLY-WYZ-14_1]|nr:helix-turn-helix transcriptional regulator [Polyangiaceae bacterium LLY-WYZ-14_1]
MADGGSARTTVLDVVDRGYDLTGTTRDWVEGVATAHRAAMGLPEGTTALTYEVDREEGSVAFDPSTLAVVDLDPVRLEAFGRSAAGVQRFPAVVRRLYGDLNAGSVTERLREWGFPEPVVTGYLEAVRPWGYADAVPVTAANLNGRGLHIVTPTKKSVPLGPAGRRRWEAVAVHLAAGLRLRDALAGGPLLDGADAVLEGDGRLADVRDEAAAAPDARERLRHAARRLDHAHSRAGRAAADETLSAWDALVDGRWTLLDHFDTDGRRYLVARRNEPIARGPKELSSRERQVVCRAAQGHPNKLIAYELGLAEGTVKAHLRRALTRLSVRGRTELTTLWADLQAAGRLTEAGIRPGDGGDGDGGLVAVDADPRHPDDDQADVFFVASRPTPSAPAVLTPAEAALLGLLRQGLSDGEIAASRGVSRRTVGNQLGAIYRKLGVTSRHELLAGEHR